MNDIKQIEPSNRMFKLISILVLGILIFLVGQLIYQKKDLDYKNQNQITVSGVGKAYAKPDIAEVSLGLRVDGQDIKTISQQNITAINKIIKDLKDLGIEEKDIQTTQYPVTPQYTWTERGGTVPNGYSIEQTISVKIRDFSKIGDVLSKASEDGANTIGGLQFTVDDTDRIKQEARAKAIQKAKANARNLVKESGISLGKIVNIYESSGPYPILYSKEISLGAGGDASVPAPEIQPGQQEISVVVNITYQIR